MFIEDDFLFFPHKKTSKIIPKKYQALVTLLNDIKFYFSPPNKILGSRDKLDKFDFNFLDIEDFHFFTDEQLLELYTIITIIIQCYRWDRCPPAAQRFEETTISFPKGLFDFWVSLSDRIGVPYNNNYIATIGNNWLIVDNKINHEKPDSYLKNLRIAYSWLKRPYHDQLEQFILSFVEMDAFSPLLLKYCRDINQIIQSNLGIETFIHPLEKLLKITQSLNRNFNKRIKDRNIAITDWKNIIHIPFAWGLVFKGEKLEGASGMQISSIQILNAILNIKDPGHIGQATKNTRKYMIQPQRRRLNDIDMIGKKLRQLIVKSNNIKVILLYNKILQVLTNWRVSHQTRGYRYLSYDDERTSYQMASGLTIETTTQSVEDIFWQHMQDRIVETENTKIKS